jgi:hypothetical protein
MQMIDMKIKKKKVPADAPTAVGESPYPYGLQINLDEDSIKKLSGIEKYDVGDDLKIVCKCCLIRKEEYERTGSKSRSMGLQIEKMGFENPGSFDDGFSMKDKKSE